MQNETGTKKNREIGSSRESNPGLAPALTALTLGILITLPTALPAQGIASSRTLFDGFTAASPSSVSDDDEQDEEGRRPGTYLLAGSALVGGALLFNFASGGGDAFPADNGLVEDNTFLNRTLRPVSPPTTLGSTPPQFGEIPFADEHPTLSGNEPTPCGDPLAGNCLDPILLGAQEDPSDVVPEPLTITMLATGMAGLAAARRRRAA
ncbi:MAG: PEP-CTERM sorting domain-containing protein [Gemmatimonadales bacterium]|nr:PEP-CTERM sorting domain-containing protein [Gemmatimonadales bacterium]